MSKRILIVVEGPTEERFVKDVLAPKYLDLELYFFPTLLVTKRIKSGPNFTGGVTTFGKFQNDVRLRLQGAGDALVTTLLDYYGLPADFPGMENRPNGGTPEQRVSHVELAVRNHFAAPNFLPFFALHEFEAWLFSSPSELPRTLIEKPKENAFAAVCNGFNSPEEINEDPNTAPSKRIENLFPAYRKVLHGPTIVGRIGLDVIRSKCPHLDGWLTQLEDFARA